MIYNDTHFRMNLWRWKCGIKELDEHDLQTEHTIDIKALTHSEWSTKFEQSVKQNYAFWSNTFEQYLRNRLIMGAIRYGKLNSLSKPDWDRIGSCYDRLVLYESDHNLEHLIDIANLCLVESVECKKALVDGACHYDDDDRTDLIWSTDHVAKAHRLLRIKSDLKFYSNATVKIRMLLVDVFALCMYEFMHPSFEDAHITAADDGIHCTKSS